jgi:hypothetical protein
MPIVCLIYVLRWRLNLIYVLETPIENLMCDVTSLAKMRSAYLDTWYIEVCYSCTYAMLRIALTRAFGSGK